MDTLHDTTAVAAARSTASSTALMHPSRPSSTSSGDAPDVAAPDAAFGTWQWHAHDGDQVLVRTPMSTAAERRIAIDAWLGVGAAEAAAILDRWRTALATSRPWSSEFDVDTSAGVRRLIVRGQAAPTAAGASPRLEGVWVDLTQHAAESTHAVQREHAHDERLHGAPVRMIGVNSDIDARKGSEVALRESEAWFRHLADALPILVWAASPEGVLDYANDAWRRYSGSVDAADWLRAVHPDDAPRLEARWNEAVQRRERFEGHARLRRAHDGQHRWHAVTAVPIAAPHGALVRWVGAFIDDHELRMLVEANQHLLASEQKARQAAEEAGRTKDEFLATLGHELRTPLNAITGWTTLLRRADLDAAARQRAVDVIERTAEAQRRLLDELLDMSRIIAGNIRLDRQRVSIGDVLAQAVDSIRPIAEARHQQVALRLDDAPATLSGDAARLQQVFANLLSNAVKFTPEHGHIAATLVNAGDHVSVHVTDDGIGIAPGFLPHVFDRFRQAPAAGRPAGGLGLGLSIVRQIVDLHGGRVSADSAGDGQGATFTVTLPLDATPGATQDSSIPAPQVADSPPSTLRGLSMLIIEDDPDSREMLSVLLENAGAVPVAAASVTEALRLLGDLEIDVVLSDIGMPERDGFDLIRSLRTFSNLRVRRAPAIAVTAFARQEDRDRILGAGFDAHVSKPVEPAELFVTIAEVVQARASEAGDDAHD